MLRLRMACLPKHKLTNDRANTIVREARKMVKANPGYRLGQAIWNLLPLELNHLMTATPLDFFHNRDEDRVLDLFYSNFTNP